MLLLILYTGLTIFSIMGQESKYTTYKGYSVIKIHPRTSQEWDYIEIVIHDMQLDIWNQDHDNGIDVFVSAEESQELLQLMENKSIPFKSTISKVDKLIDDEHTRLHQRSGSTRQRRKTRGVSSDVPFDLDDCNTFESMMSQLDVWKGDCTQKQLRCDTVSIGQSALGEDIKMFKIGKDLTARTSESTPTSLHHESHAFSITGTQSETTEEVSTYFMTNSDKMMSSKKDIPSTTVPITSGSSRMLNPFTTLADMYFSRTPPNEVPTKGYSDTTASNDNVSEKALQKDIWISCLIHAREWITGPTCMKIIHELITQYGTDPVITDLVNRYNWNILPVLNPDGYKYTWTSDRFWRKNRQPTPNENCTGIDLNRNFNTGLRCNNTVLYKEVDSQFGTVMSSRDPCSYVYCGHNSIDNITTAPEVSAIENTILHGDLNASVVIDIHSYAWMWLAPSGTVETVGPPYKCTISNDYLIHNGVSQLAAGASARAGYFKNIWRDGNICQVIYPVSGSLTDFVYEQAGVKHSYAVEMRGGANDTGFLTTKTDIQEGFTEVWEALLEIMKSVDKLDKL